VLETVQKQKKGAVAHSSAAAPISFDEKYIKIRKP